MQMVKTFVMETAAKQWLQNWKFNQRQCRVQVSEMESKDWATVTKIWQQYSILVVMIDNISAMSQIELICLKPEVLKTHLKCQF